MKAYEVFLNRLFNQLRPSFLICSYSLAFSKIIYFCLSCYCLASIDSWYLTWSILCFFSSNYDAIWFCFSLCLLLDISTFSLISLSRSFFALLIASSSFLFCSFCALNAFSFFCLELTTASIFEFKSCLALLILPSYSYFLATWVMANCAFSFSNFW